MDARTARQHNRSKLTRATRILLDDFVDKLTKQPQANEHGNSQLAQEASNSSSNVDLSNSTIADCANVTIPLSVQTATFSAIMNILDSKNNSNQSQTRAPNNLKASDSNSMQLHLRAIDVAQNSSTTTPVATSSHAASASTSSTSNNSALYGVQTNNIMATSSKPIEPIISSGVSDQLEQALNSPQVLKCDIKSLFECPICFDHAVPPIYQCQNGHLVCQDCSCKITNCPTCRVPISAPAIRNLQLDRLANTFQFPCKFNFNGCSWRSYWFKKREHEEECEFISYSCPCPGTACKWMGLLTDVMLHLKEHHKSITTLSGEDIVFLATDVNLKGAVDWVMIQSCFNHHFLLVLEKHELKTGQQQFFAIVQLIGSQKDAEKFKYRLELSSSASGQMKRLLWEATPRSILDGIQTEISTHDCLVFDARTAQHFLSPIQKDKDIANSLNQTENQGENLGINVTIECLV